MSALKGYKFADALSRNYAECGMNSDRPAVYLIVGPPMSGKTRLAEEILRRSAVTYVGMCCPSSEAEMRKHCDMAAIAGGLFLDGLKPWRGNSTSLLTFLVSERWTFRKLGTQACVTIVNNCLTVITMNGKPSEDLKRRCLMIELLPRTKVTRKAAKKGASK